MNSIEHHIAFGPVPSRRLGESLGINNVTTKACSYACIYCQVGPTTEKLAAPRRFFSPEEIYRSVAARLAKVRAAGIKVDYLSFVPDGEPTLDSSLGESIEMLRDLRIPIAVITNGSLLWREEVRSQVAGADLVSVKVDSVVEHIWRSINQPHPELDFDQLLKGICAFAAEFNGSLISDTMLIAGLNDDHDSLGETADFLSELNPDTAYLAVPTRPTTLRSARGTDTAGLIRAHQIFSATLSNVELLTGHEAGAFGYTGDARTDLLATTAVHPMREDEVQRLLADNHTNWTLVETLLSEGVLIEVEHQGVRFYLRPVKSSG